MKCNAAVEGFKKEQMTQAHGAFIRIWLLQGASRLFFLLPASLGILLLT